MKESPTIPGKKEILSRFAHEVEAELGELKGMIFHHILEKKSLIDLATQARDQKKNVIDLIDDLITSTHGQEGSLIETLWNKAVGWLKGKVLDFLLGWREIITTKREETTAIIKKTEQSLSDLGSSVHDNTPNKNNTLQLSPRQQQPEHADHTQQEKKHEDTPPQHAQNTNTHDNKTEHTTHPETITQEVTMPSQLQERITTLDESMKTETFILTRALQLGYIPTGPGPWTTKDLLSGKRLAVGGKKINEFLASILLPLWKNKLTHREGLAHTQGIHNNPLLTDLRASINNPKSTGVFGGAAGLTIIATMGKYLESGKPDKLTEYSNKIGKSIIEKTINTTETIRNHHHQSVIKIEQELKHAIAKNPSQQASLTQEAQIKVTKLTHDTNTKLKPYTDKLLLGTRYCDEQTLNELKQKYGALDDLLTANGGTKKLVSKRKKIGEKGEKILTGGAAGFATIGIGIALLNADTRKDKALVGADIGLGMIPIVGGIYDLGAAIAGKDITGNDLSGAERRTRAGFGILGLIPGVGTLIKGGAAIGKGAKAIHTAAKILSIVDTGIIAAKMIGKTATYSYLGYSIGTIAFDVVHSGGELAQPIFDHLHDIIDPLPALDSTP
ncbi:MAG: pre-toxin TG domain-containing protein [Candidatus Absconditabacterales bacterium]|nr:pre-toxin TG domain-containing protein [Candidatus Absconditabacterales bacterium]